MIIRNDLLETAAKAITGFDITVRHRTPAVIDALGCAHCSETGQRFIDLKPGLARDKFLFVFLHECAHWKISNGKMKRTNIHSMKPFSWEIESEMDEELEKKLENGCDYLAERWLNWAKEKTKSNPFLICEDTARVITLADYETT